MTNELGKDVAGADRSIADHVLERLAGSGGIFNIGSDKGGVGAKEGEGNTTKSSIQSFGNLSTSTATPLTAAMNFNCTSSANVET